MNFRNNNKNTTIFDGERKIGIPRAISYYYNYPFYYSFFKTIGYEVVLSDKTTAKTVNDGCKFVVSDTCLPIKVFVGHVVNLLNKGVVNIFVPSIQSIGYKINNCSKIRGLPEIIRNVIDVKFNMIEPTYDMTEKIGLKEFCTETANSLGVFDDKLINEAIEAGIKTYKSFRKMTQSGVPYLTALENSLHETYENKYIQLVRPLSVAIMAHGYNLFDERISLSLIKKLEQMNIRVYTSLNIDEEDSLKSIQALGERQYWANEVDLTGAAAYYLLNKKVDGIIALSAFGCGPDSLMVDEISYHAKKSGMPMLHLTVDEHTGEAGFVTRIEAFVDMLHRRKRKGAAQKQQRVHTPEKVAQEEKVLLNSLK